MSETKKEKTEDIFPIKSLTEIKTVNVDADKRNESIKKMIAAAPNDVLFIDFAHKGILVHTGDVIIEKGDSGDPKKSVYIANIGKTESDVVKMILVKAVKDSLEKYKIKTKDLTIIVLDAGSGNLVTGLITEEVFGQPVFVEHINHPDDMAFSLEMDGKKKDKKKKKNKKKKGKGKKK